MPTWQSKWTKIPGRTWRFAQPPIPKMPFPQLDERHCKSQLIAVLWFSQDGAVRWYSILAAIIGRKLENHLKKHLKRSQEIVYLKGILAFQGSAQCDTLFSCHSDACCDPGRWFNFPFRATSLCPDTTVPESQNRSKEIMEGMPELVLWL